MLVEKAGGWKKLAIGAGLAVAAGLVAAVIFVWSGLYNVSAARDHFGVTTWLLEQVRDRSVATHSVLIDVPPLNDPAKIRLGGAHYESVCVLCHARPGEAINAAAAAMLPAPPHLAEALKENSAEEIFWTVKHGLKYTGMPAFPAQNRDDEVWAVTAFLVQLVNSEPPATYRSLAGLDRLAPPAVSGAPSHGTQALALTQCIRCHDDDDKPVHAASIPRLSGQSPAYLRRALVEYAAGLRPSGIMQPVADALSADEIERLAAYYAGLSGPALEPEVVMADLERGRLLALRGDRDEEIPACLSCHGRSGSPQFPKLFGQNLAYLRQQLEVWRAGGRDQSTYGQIMAPIARRLTDEQLRDVTAYFAATPEPVMGLASDGEGSAVP